MSRADRERWDKRYQLAQDWRSDEGPFPWLADHAPAGKGDLALDIACGLGHNTLWLAERGHRAVGIDASGVALRHAVEAARRRSLTEQALFVLADLEDYCPAPSSASLVCVIRYLNRDLFPALARALKPGGWLIMATFNQVQCLSHPDLNPAYLLEPDELRTAFPDLEVADYAEQNGLSCLAARRW